MTNILYSMRFSASSNRQIRYDTAATIVLGSGMRSANLKRFPVLIEAPFEVFVASLKD